MQLRRATEWNDNDPRPMLGAGGLKVYNAVPACGSDGRFQDGTCAEPGPVATMPDRAKFLLEVAKVEKENASTPCKQ